jgi:TRAP-type C4-dicarboxylate transport system permease small subunit
MEKVLVETQESRVLGIFDTAIKGTVWIASALIVLMMLLIVLEIFKRYVLNAPSLWISDFVASYLVIYITLLPAAWILLQNGHVNVDLVVSCLGARKRLRLKIVTNILGLTYSIILTWQGWLFMWRELTHGTYLPTAAKMPLWPAVAAIFLGGVFMGIGFIMVIIRDFHLRKGNHSVETRS